MTRLGLTQRVTVVEEYGERRDCLDQEWTTLLEGSGYTPVPLPNEIDDVDGYLESLGLDGIVLTSGNDLAHLEQASNPAPERDRFETAVLDWALDGGIPVCGVCRGLEFLNVYFGGSLSRVEGHVATEHPVEFDSIPRPDSDASGGTPPLLERIDVNSYHGYGIRPDDVADPLVAVGTAPDDTVECLLHETAPVCGIMWHPERETPSTEVDRQLFQWLFGGGTHD